MFKSWNQVEKNKLGLMGSILINNVLYMFINTFLVAYFFKLSNYNYKIISIFYVFSFIFIPLTFFILSKRIDKRKVQVFRTGILLHTLFILLLALLKENIIKYFIPLGMLYGIVQGMFWCSGHILVNIYAGNDSKNFVSLKSMISKTLKIIFPFIFGTSIEYTSFSSVAFIVLILAFIQFLFSILIKDIPHGNHTFSLRKYMQYLKTLRSNDLKTCYQITALDGVVNYLLETVVTIIIVMTFKTNISLGFLTTVFAICSIAALFIFQRKIKDNTQILKLSSILVISSIFLLLIDINKVTVIIYNLVNSIFLVLLINSAEAKRYSIASSYERVKKEFMIEHQTLCEYAINFVRIIAYIILFITSLTNNIALFKILLVGIASCIYLYASFIIKINK